MRSQYTNLVVPAGAGGADGSQTLPELDAAGAGAAPAAGAQETAATALGGVDAVMSGREPPARKHGGRRGGCSHCWMVALGAIVVIALVAK